MFSVKRREIAELAAKQRAARRRRAVSDAALPWERGADAVRDGTGPACSIWSSFTKLIAPGVRTGFMLGDAAILGKLAKVAEDTDISPGYVAQAITYEWCRRGLLPPQIERLKKLCAPRLDACLAGIEQIHAGGEGDQARWRVLHLADAARGREHDGRITQAATKGLNLADGLAFFPEGGGERFVRLPFCALSPQEIDEGGRDSRTPCARRRRRGRAIVERGFSPRVDVTVPRPSWVTDSWWDPSSNSLC